MQPSVNDTQPMPPPEMMKPPGKKRLPFPIPWGLFVVLGIYALAVVGYIHATYWSTNEYIAAEHVEAGAILLGSDEGKSLDQKKMEEVYAHYLEAARLMPELRWIHEKLQRIRYKMDERGMKLPQDLVMRGEALAILLQRSENEGAPMLVVGARDRGWTAEAVLTGPKTVALWSIPGGILISIFVFFRTWTEHRLRGDEHESDSKKREKELRDLERARTMGSINEDGSYKDTEEKDMLMQERPRPSKAGARSTNAGTKKPAGERPSGARPKKKP
jgi:hypothetical protein